PISVVSRLLKKPCPGQVHPATLHGVRIGSLRENGQIPAKVIFLIGMNEENFPKNKISSSLDLLKGKGENSADFDRYAFLQAILNAEECIRISYCHLSADEGKPVGPSLVIQELLDCFSRDLSLVYRNKD